MEDKLRRPIRGSVWQILMSMRENGMAASYLQWRSREASRFQECSWSNPLLRVSLGMKG